MCHVTVLFSYNVNTKHIQLNPVKANSAIAYLTEVRERLTLGVLRLTINIYS